MVVLHSVQKNWKVIEDMLQTIGNTCLQVMERVADVVPIDCLSIHEDMAGRSGPC